MCWNILSRMHANHIFTTRYMKKKRGSIHPPPYKYYRIPSSSRPRIQYYLPREEEDDAFMTFPPFSSPSPPQQHMHPPHYKCNPLTPTHKTHTPPGIPKPQGNTPSWSCTRCTSCSSRPPRSRGTSARPRRRSGRRRSLGDRRRRREGPPPRPRAPPPPPLGWAVVLPRTLVRLFLGGGEDGESGVFLYGRLCGQDGSDG